MHLPLFFASSSTTQETEYMSVTLFFASSSTTVYVEYVQQREGSTDGIMTRQSYTFTIPSLPRGEER